MDDLDHWLHEAVQTTAGARPPRPPLVSTIDGRRNGGRHQVDYTRRRLLAGGAAAGLVGLTAVALSTRGGKDPADAAGTSDSGAASGSTGAPATLPPSSTAAAVVESVPVARVPLTRTINDGMAGDDVKLIQQRLVDLKFDPGKPDGVYGLRTKQAVWAFEKLILKVPRQKATGAVTPETWELMQDSVVVFPRRTDLSNTHVEVYIPEQVLVVFEGSRPLLITHVSTGTGETWCSEVTIDPGEDGNEKGTEPLVKGICGVAKTTGGTFKFTRKFLDGWREGKLGRMYKPVYWNYGLAVHGSSKVPNEPASHGCVRTPMHIAEYFPDMVHKYDDIWVWDGDHEPEYWSNQLPVFDYPDPDWIPPSTTTTAPSTTTGPTTTVKGSTTTTRASNSTAAPTTGAPTTAAPATSPPTTAPPPATTAAPAEQPPQ